MLAGGAILAIASAVRGEPFAAPSARAAWVLGYLIVMGSLVAYSAFGWVLKNARPALATSYAYVNPVVALLIGTLVGGERLRARRRRGARAGARRRRARQLVPARGGPRVTGASPIAARAVLFAGQIRRRVWIQLTVAAAVCARAARRAALPTLRATAAGPGRRGVRARCGRRGEVAGRRLAGRRHEVCLVEDAVHERDPIHPPAVPREDVHAPAFVGPPAGVRRVHQRAVRAGHDNPTVPLSAPNDGIRVRAAPSHAERGGGHDRDERPAQKG
jgi:hypothetical protein